MPQFQRLLVASILVIGSIAIYGQMSPKEAQKQLVEQDRQLRLKGYAEGRVPIQMPNLNELDANEMQALVSGLYIRMSKVQQEQQAEKQQLLTELDRLKVENNKLSSQVKELEKFKEFAPVQVPTEKSPTIEMVDVLPGKYIGQTLTFTRCEIGQRPGKVSLQNSGGELPHDWWAIGVTSPGGKHISPSPSDGITFIVDKAMIDQFAPHLQGGFDWFNCTIRCRIVKFNNYVCAVVDAIDVYNKGGKISLEFRMQNPSQDSSGAENKGADSDKVPAEKKVSD